MKIKPQDLTLAIITKNRPHKLARLLVSLGDLTALPGVILIIDNDLQQSAKSTYQQWRSKLPLKYSICKKPGAPSARNYALDHCQTQFLCFIDDDCVVDINWTKVLLRALNDSQPGFILGKSELLNKNNFWARLQYDRYQKWMSGLIKSDRVLPLFFDTKNVCLNLQKIDKDKLRFDVIFSGLSTAGGEDVDFGLKLNTAGIKGRYLPLMLVKHEEISSFWKLIKKTFQKGKLEKLLYKKWQMCHVGERSQSDFLSKIFFLGFKSIK